MAGEEPFLDVVADQRGCPTNAGDLAQALMEFVTSDLQGICYVPNTGDCTRHKFAETIVSLMDLSTPVRPSTNAQAGRLARRPPTPSLPKAGRVRGGHCSLIGRMHLPDL